MGLIQDSEELLETTLEDSDLFGRPIVITFYDGEQQTIYGSVTYTSLNEEGFRIGKPTATVRISSLNQVIDPSNPIHVRIPKSPINDTELEDYICERPPNTNKGFGLATFLLTKAEQS